MKSVVFAVGLAALLVAIAAAPAAGHCQVPCGIYADSLRFDSMLEDARTIRKAMSQIRVLADVEGAPSLNQAVRWVKTKEEHATRTQGVIADYFMAQRIKTDQADYAARLAAAHAVTRAAMRCKQSTDEATATALVAAIRRFRVVYEEPAEAAPGHEHP